MPDELLEAASRAALVLVAVAFCAADGAGLLARRPPDEALLFGLAAALVVGALARLVLTLLEHVVPPVAAPPAPRPEQPPSGSGE
jgi:hypothetical protein